MLSIRSKELYGSDSIRDLICGYSVRDRERKLLVVLQAFVDDSKSDLDHRDFVLAGYMSLAPQWMAFSDDWQRSLDEYPSIEFFHMVEAQNLRGQFDGWDERQRDAKVLKMAQVIDRHPLLSFDSRMSRASWSRIVEPVVAYDLRNPFLIVFQSVVATAARLLYDNGIDVPIDFVFDDQGRAGDFASTLYGFLKAHQLPSHLRPLLGARPIFRDDKKVLPLQAADMLAWHLRRSREERFAGEKRETLDLLRKNKHYETWIPDSMLQSWADQMAKIRGIEDVRTKNKSVKKEMIAIEERLAQMPTEEKAYERFSAAMTQLLSVSKEELNRRLEAEKKAKASAFHGPASS